MCISTYENHVVALSSAGEECGLVLVGGAGVCVFTPLGVCRIIVIKSILIALP